MNAEPDIKSMKKFKTLSRKILSVDFARTLLAVGSCGLTLSCGTKKEISGPNIILILSDDHSPGAISSYGHSLIATPNIDRIAANGIRFNNCFAVVSLSAPSRAAILTGRHSANNSVLRIGDVFDSTQVTFPRILHDAGYQTALFGKWHLRSEPVGFDYYNIVHDQGAYYNCPVKNSGEKWIMGRGENVIPGYLTDALTDMSIRWLENRDRKKPFCLLLHHKAPHHPWVYPSGYDTIFADKDLPEPGSFSDDYKGKNRYLANEPCGFSKLQYILPYHIEPIPDSLAVGSEEYKKWAYQKVFKDYYRLVASLDDNIGRLLDYLKETRLDKNTIIIYMSDNGFFLGDHGLFNKQWMYEESIRIPLIISMPGKVNRGKAIDNIITEVDVASTILNFACLPVPPEFQGQSLKPLIEGKVSEEWRKSFFYHYFNQYQVPENYGLRTERFKLINVIGSDFSDWEFYDLESDPEEMVNQINNPDFRQTVDSLKSELATAREKCETKATFPE